MVSESGSVSSHYVAMPREVTSLPSGVSFRSKADVQDNIQLPSGLSDRQGMSSLYAQIRASGDQRGEAAVQLRQTHQGLQQAGDLLAQIKERLLHIVKQYPPFTLDSPQRIAYLNAITGLRKQLDALTFPPRRQEGNVSSEGGGWQQASPPSPPSPRPGDLSIPKLDPLSASDIQVRTALDAVTKAQGKVNEAEDGLWQDMVRYVGEPNMGQLADNQAQAKARQVSGYIAAHPVHGIGVNASSLLAGGS
jgi:hypothetical protein